MSTGTVMVVLLVSAGLSFAAVALVAVLARGHPLVSIGLGLALGLGAGFGSALVGVGLSAGSVTYDSMWQGLDASMSLVPVLMLILVVVVIVVLVAAFGLTAVLNRMPPTDRPSRAVLDPDRDVFESKWD